MRDPAAIGRYTRITSTEQQKVAELMSVPVPATQPRLLYRLQQLDLRLAEAHDRLSTLDSGEELRARLALAQETQTAAARDLEERQGRIRTRELELQSTVAKRKRVEEEMYSGRVRNPKELASMQDELGQLDRQARGLEDEILALMEEVEALLARTRSLADETTALQETLGAHEEAFAREERMIQETIPVLERERETMVGAIEPALLRRYERIRPLKAGVAVSAVRNGICEGCHVAIPEGRLRQLEQREDAVVTCEGCGRLLVLPES